MPVMDGLEATRQIRELERQAGGHVPIVALTAGVLREEKDKCIAAGMDDFLGKPVNMEKLRQALEVHLPRHTPATSPA